MGEELELLLAERGKNIWDIIGPIGKLHNLIIYIRKSANYIIWFKEYALKIIPLNNYIRWNSWYNILSIALEDRVKAGL